MSCGPLNGLLTSSVDSHLLGPSLTGLYNNSFNPKVASVSLSLNLSCSYQNGLLTSSLQCDNSILYFGEDKTIRNYSYNLEAALSSSMPLELCRPRFTFE